ncbi:MAG: NCS1 family nucleobase:cation symporter-1, partial [Alphaproteobacteria bacterium]|nr:NCS1 family nucleobase:cation symporter-1 [Alphaproteobacteria bacterium]
MPVIPKTERPDAPGDPRLWNADIAATPPAQRTWTWLTYAGLWVAMVIQIPAYLIAADLIASGMSWWQAVLTVFLGNLIVLVPLVLIGHAGAKYGIPFPVLLRSSFGTIGARLPAMLRGVVACGWFGIQTWVGGSAIYVILTALTGNAAVGAAIPVIGIDPAQLLCFLLFWGVHLWFITKGIESVRWLEMLAAPFLLLAGIVLLAWAYQRAGGFGQMLSQPSAFGPGGRLEGQFWAVFWPSLTAMIGFWATLALNIPDFTRFARSQKDQMIGQAIGLPIPMAMIAFIGVSVTSATVIIFGEPVWDPIQIAARLQGPGVVLILGFVVIATLTTNLAANVVAPANDIANLDPRRISFRTGGYITAGLGIAIFPWKLLETADVFIFTWLVGYSALLGPIAGVILSDYYLLRRAQ